MQISNHSILELRWWVSNSKQFSKPLIVRKPCLTITTDASLNGWGAVCNNEKTGGLWSIAEKSNNINYLEMLAMFFGLKVFAIYCTDCHIRIMTDNTTAVSVLTHMGTNHSQSCNPLCNQYGNGAFIKTHGSLSLIFQAGLMWTPTENQDMLIKIAQNG